MSKSMQKILAAMSVAMIVLLVAPAPSLAAQARRPASERTLGLMDQVWSWLGSLLGNSTPHRSVPAKTMTTPPQQPLPPPPEQGPLIDPNGGSNG